jgi:membrane-associated protease RseP (regulator of RpoE activity)
MRVRSLALLLFAAAGVIVLLWRGAVSNEVETRPPSMADTALPQGASNTQAPPDASAVSPERAAPPDLAALAAALEEERAARRALAEEVAALRIELARLSKGDAAPAPVPKPPPAASDIRVPAPFDEQALLDAGFDPREAARLRERVETFELERLYLRDRATREGWAGTQRFAEEARALEARGRALRDELGDDRYDWLLYASGQSNRVVVQSVMERSPASDAGIRPGDAILAYDSARLFDASTLRDATTQGRAGESVAVEVTRGSEVLRLFVPRGPLGVRLEETRLKPQG